MNSTKLKRKQSIGYFGAFIALGMGMAVLGPSLPRLAENTGSTISQTMDAVGRSIAPELRCTALGGLSVTETSREIERRLKHSSGER